MVSAVPKIRALEPLVLNADIGRVRISWVVRPPLDGSPVERLVPV
jgi:hypothetical protein